MKNIDSIKYFTEKWETVDNSYKYTVPYHKDIDPNFESLPTFVAEFNDCKVHSCPLLVTYQQKLIRLQVCNNFQMLILLWVVHII